VFVERLVDVQLPARHPAGEFLVDGPVAARALSRLVFDALEFPRGRVDYEIRGAVGDYSEQVVSVAEALEADLVLVGGRKRSPTGKAVFGSVAQEILLSAPCPVTFVRADTK
jgi:nucleotide-binding universal stress UspA family protein